jgi:hypothetical protein
MPAAACQVMRETTFLDSGLMVHPVSCRPCNHDKRYGGALLACILARLNTKGLPRVSAAPAQAKLYLEYTSRRGLPHSLLIGKPRLHLCIN